MSDQIKHESVKAWLESDPKKLRKIMRKIVIDLLYLRYSIWCIKNSKTKDHVDKKTFYKYIACCSSPVIPSFFKLKKGI